jgi:hypothetical protein
VGQITPALQRAEAELSIYADVRPLLSAIQAPTLVLYRIGTPGATPSNLIGRRILVPHLTNDRPGLTAGREAGRCEA